MQVSYRIGTVANLGNVVARNQFTPAQQAVMDRGGNYAGYAVVNGHYTYVGSGRTGQSAYYAVFPNERPAANPDKGSWMSPGGPAPAPKDPESPAAIADDAAAKRPDQNAYELLMHRFKDWGLEGLGPKILAWLVDGYEPDTITLLIQDTDEYKQRFSGNEARRRNGLAVLRPGDYLATEASFAQILRSAGLPPGFYDDPKTDFADWIGKDVSPTEVKGRVDLAVQRVNDSNPETLQALAAYYGITAGSLTAYFLDQKRALPILQKQAAAADIGAASLHHGLSLTGAIDAERYADQGVTGQQAQQAYGAIAGLLPGEQAIGQRFGEQYTQTDAEQELLGGMASARRKRELLNDKEQSLFSGSGAAGASSLGQRTGGSY